MICSGRARSAPLALAFTLFMTGGCGTTPTPRSPGIGEPSPRSDLAPTTIDPRVAYPTTTGAETWRIVDGNDAGTTQLRERATTGLFNADLTMRIGDRRTQYWASINDSVAMTATHAHRDRAISLFDPPLTIAPASLRLGEPHEAIVAMTVVDENDMTRVRHRGTATRRMTWTGDVTVETPTGQALAHRIETLFVADLDLARAEERATLLLLPGVGFVSEDRVETIRAIGIFSRTVRQSIRRDAP